jgi:hypothetical protein
MRSQGKWLRRISGRSGRKIRIRREKESGETLREREEVGKNMSFMPANDQKELNEENKDREGGKRDKRERREGERVDENKLRRGLIISFLYSII